MLNISNCCARVREEPQSCWYSSEQHDLKSSVSSLLTVRPDFFLLFLFFPLCYTVGLQRQDLGLALKFYVLL